MTANRRSRMTRAALPLLAASLLLLQPASALASPASHSGTADDPIPIHAGQTLQARMPEGDPYEATVAFELISPVTGPLTIDARSLDFDTFLVLSRVEPDGGLSILRMDDHTGDATNARIVIEAETNVRYRIEVQPEWLLYCGDEFEISVTLGQSPEAYRTIRENDWCTTPAPYYEAMTEKTAAKEDPGCRVANLIAESFRHSPGNDWRIENDPGVWDKENREFAEKAEALAREELEPGHPASLAAMDRLGHVLTLAGKYDEAVSALQRALDDAGRRYGPDHVANARIIQHLREAHRFVLRGGPEDPYGYGGAATKEITAAFVAKIEAALGPDHLITAQWKSGQAGEPLPDDADVQAQERWFAVMERLRGPGHPELALDLNRISFSLTVRGEDLEAIPIRERALPLMEKACGPDHWLTANWMTKLANMLHNTGEIVRVERLRRESVEILERQDNPLLAQFLLYLFPVLLELGETQEAEELLERVQRIHDAKRGPDPEALWWQRWNLHLARDEYEEARTLLERDFQDEGLEEWLAGFKRLQGVLFLSRVGRMYTEVGELQNARMILERALQIVESAIQRMGLEDHPRNHLILAPLGRVLLELGELEEARRHLERATRLQAESAEHFGPGLGDPESSFLLARTLAALGEADGAFGAAIKAEKVGRNRLRLIAGGLPERLGLAYASLRLPGLDLALSMLRAGRVSTADAAERAWDSLVRSRAAVLDETAARNHLLHASADPEIRRLTEDVMAARSRLAHVALRGAGNQPPKAYQMLLTDLSREMERADRALASKSDPFRVHGRSMRIGLDDVRAALPKESALVGYVRFEEIPAGRSLSGEKPAGESDPASTRYGAFVLASPSGEPRFVPLAGGGEIERAVDEWRRAIAEAGERDDRPAARAADGSRTRGERLRRLVWDPIGRHLGGARRVFVVPAGALNLVNVAALPDAESGYLLESGPLIHYLSAERDLARTEAGREPGRGLVAMGGPDFDSAGLFAALRSESSGGESAAEPATDSDVESGAAEAVQVAALRPFRGERSACSVFEGTPFRPLSHAEGEVRDIAALWRRALGAPGDPSSDGSDTSASSRGEGDLIVLTGSGATETAFKDDARGTRVLHLATHGFFLGGGCESALERRRGFGAVVTAARATPPPVKGENPLILSGLALAGANHREHAREDEDDGILTAQEIAAMDLSGVEWAVLSACDTGVGEIRAGEGVFGLQRAFQVAGAGTLIMSLWSVEDESARRWMKTLYEGRLIQELDTAEAVRQASLKVLRERREKNESTHPFYWAGFVAAGDWR